MGRWGASAGTGWSTLGYVGGGCRSQRLEFWLGSGLGGGWGWGAGFEGKEVGGELGLGSRRWFGRRAGGRRRQGAEGLAGGKNFGRIWVGQLAGDLFGGKEVDGPVVLQEYYCGYR